MTPAPVLPSPNRSPDNPALTRLRRRWSEFYDRTVDELGDSAVAQPRLRALHQLGTVIDRLERDPTCADPEILAPSADSVNITRENHGRDFYTTAELVQRLREALDEVTHVSSGQ